MNIPEGFKLVPVEPTAAMEEAGCQGYMSAEGTNGPSIMHLSSMGYAYKSMLAAATPPQPSYDEDAERSACRKEWKGRNEHSHLEPIPFPDYWAGWKDGAQSRAKSGEVGHE